MTIMVAMLIIVVLAGFIGAGAAPWLARTLKARAACVVAVLPAVLFAYFLWQAPGVARGHIVRAGLPWIPSLGIRFSFQLDGLGLLFALIVSGIGALVALYAGDYLAGREDIGRFYAYHVLFMASMLGVVLADDLVVLFVFWELTSVTSYLLIGLDHERPEARAGALKALLVTGGGGLALLAGVILLGQAAGGYEISRLTASPALDFQAPLILPGLALILLGAFTKSAQWPFHIWLPDAMQAPTPVSAYLHSATMVKAGIYLLARLLPVLGHHPAWVYAVSAVGMVTMLAGGLLALKQTDLKAILAYTTISWLGTLVMLLGWGNTHAVQAAMLGVLAHALYKGALFLLAGGIDHETGTRDIRALGRLRTSMPLSATLMGLAAFSMAGLPLLLGFVAKELLLEAALHSPYPPAAWWLAPAATVVASLLNVAIALRLFHGVFFAPPTLEKKGDRIGHDPPPFMLLGPAVLASVSLLLGVWPALANALIAQAASVALAEALEVKLAIYHGLTVPLALSMGAIAAGLGLYLVYARAAGLASTLLRLSFNAVYDAGLAGMMGLAKTVTVVLQNGTFRYYLMTILAAATILVGGTLAARGQGIFHWADLELTVPWPSELLLCGVIVVTALMVTRVTSRLVAIAGMGVIGALVSLFYAWYSAPDLAVTQLVIETLMVIVFLLAFHFLPRFFQERTSRPAQVRDVMVSAMIGVLAAGLALFAMGIQSIGGLDYYDFIAHSSKPVHGHNVVNVILVDFRGFDTLGEISVLAIAATGIYALLKGRAPVQAETDPQAVPDVDVQRDSHSQHQA
jgi:multicomponent Na+:H+ antiporter subunit A